MNIVITGGSRGFGRAIAEKLHTTHTCILIARASEALTETGQKLGCKIYACDVTSGIEVQKTIETIEATNGPIDVLINNAGTWIEGALETNSYEEIARAIQTNVLGVMYVAKAVIPAMKTRQNGFIINVSYQSGFKTKAERSVYQASKWAVRGFSHSLLEELHSFNIRVTTLYPGTAQTELFARGKKQVNPEKSLRAEDMAETVAWLIAQPPSVVFPEIGFKHLHQ